MLKTVDLRNKKLLHSSIVAPYSWWDVADSGFHVVGNPFNKVRRVLVLSVEHLLVDFFH